MSGWKQNLKKRYDEHKHCITCGVAIPIEKEYCSIECKDKYTGFEKKKSRNNYLSIIFMVVIMVVFIFLIPMLTASG
jgi:predicted nucleic acid-binding Zn ribbon protein